MKPIVVIGGGIAGVAACLALRRARREALLVEASGSLGGRAASFAAPGWIADIGLPLLKGSDATLLALARELGMAADVVSVQGTIRGPAAPRGGALALRAGFQSLFDRAAREIPTMLSTPVAALRWSPGDRAFLLRDAASGRTLRWPGSDQPVHARGVILAVPLPAAAALARASAPLQPCVGALRKVRTRPGFCAVYRIPRVDPGFFAQAGGSSERVEWLCLEERKHPTRTRAGESLVVAQAGEALATHACSVDGATAVGLLWRPVAEILHTPAMTWLESWAFAWDASRIIPGRDLVIGPDGIPTDPPGLPLALAGDYAGGGTAEGAAASGVAAARSVHQRLVP